MRTTPRRTASGGGTQRFLANPPNGHTWSALRKRVLLSRRMQHLLPHPHQNGLAVQRKHPPVTFHGGRPPTRAYEIWVVQGSDGHQHSNSKPSQPTEHRPTDSRETALRPLVHPLYRMCTQSLLDRYFPRHLDSLRPRREARPWARRSLASPRRHVRSSSASLGCPRTAEGRQSRTRCSISRSV